MADDVWLKIEVGGKHGFVDDAGQVLVAPEYDFVSAIGDDRAFVRQGDAGAVVNRAGERLSEVDARSLRLAREDRIAFIRGGLWGFMDGEGQEVVAPRFESVFGVFEDGVVRVADDRNDQRLVDRDGQVVLPEARELRCSPQGGLVPFKNDKKKWGLYSVREREVVVAPAFAMVFFHPACRHWILKKSAKSWGAADENGEIVIPPKLPWLNVITEDRGATRNKAGAVGFVDGEGTVVIEHRFESRGGQDDMSRFSDGRCGIQVDGKIGFIDRSGEVVVPPRFINGFFYGEGRGDVVDEDGWTYIDEAGEPITTERFTRAETFADGIGVVSRGAQKGALRRDGTLIVPVAFSSVGAAKGVLSVRSEAGHTAYYRADGSCIWKHEAFDAELTPALA